MIDLHLRLSLFFHSFLRRLLTAKYEVFFIFWNFLSHVVVMESSICVLAIQHRWKNVVMIIAVSRNISHRFFFSTKARASCQFTLVTTPYLQPWRANFTLCSIWLRFEQSANVAAIENHHHKSLTSPRSHVDWIFESLTESLSRLLSLLLDVCTHSYDDDFSSREVRVKWIE